MVQFVFTSYNNAPAIHLTDNSSEMFAKLWPCNPWMEGYQTPVPKNPMRLSATSLHFTCGLACCEILSLPFTSHQWFLTFSMYAPLPNQQSVLTQPRLLKKKARIPLSLPLPSRSYTCILYLSLLPHCHFIRKYSVGLYLVQNTAVTLYFIRKNIACILQKCILL